MKHLLLVFAFAATGGAATAFIMAQDGAFEIFTITALLALGGFILAGEHQADQRWRHRRYRAEVWARRDAETQQP